MMTADDIEMLVGIPWTEFGDGPLPHGDPERPDPDSWAFECRACFRYVQERFYGRRCPDLTGVDVLSERAVIRGFAEVVPASGWRSVSRPNDGSAVLMRRGKWADHIGTWVACGPGGILHSVRGSGVGFHSRQVAEAQGLFVAGYYDPPEEVLRCC